MQVGTYTLVNTFSLFVGSGLGGIYKWGFPGSSAGKESTCNVGDPGSIPGWGRASGEGIGFPLQCSCLENSMDGGAWRATAHGVV